MDDITWPPKKRANLEIVPGPRSKLSPKNSAAASSSPNDGPDDSGPTDEVPPALDEPETSDDAPQKPNKSDRPGKRHPLVYLRHLELSKKQWALVIVAVIILLVGAGFGAKALYQHFRKVPAQAPQQVVVPEPTPAPVAPTTEASILTGVQVPIGTNKRPVTGIMIENSPDARPQSGLKYAGVVYEAIAEGGITRFLTLFQEDRPDYIGPVRSVRPYYLDFLAPYDAGIAHVGGAPQALAEIKAQGIKDLDQFANSGSYVRVSNRYAPHNVYTDFDKMDALNNAKGFNSSTFTGFLRKADGHDNVKNPKPSAKAVNINISAPLYNVHYDYNAPTNSYNRSEGGGPHKDERSGNVLSPKVVITLVMNRGIAGDGQHTQYTTTGSGGMYVFQDGIVIEGTWKKAARKSQFEFFDDTGAKLPLNAGQTWITIVDGKNKVGVTP